MTTKQEAKLAMLRAAVAARGAGTTVVVIPSLPEGRLPKTRFSLESSVVYVLVNGKGHVAISANGAVDLPFVRSFPGSYDAAAISADTLEAQCDPDGYKVRPGAPTTNPRAISSPVGTPKKAGDPWKFVLQFPPSEIPALVERRLINVAEAEASEAGQKIAAGDYSQTNLKVIVAWKNEGRWLERVMSYLEQNTEEDVARALRQAVTATDERDAIESLCRLKGVGVPTASAVMTEIRPDKYTIIDVNALKSLGVTDELKNEIEYYVAYLRHCCELASKFGVSLREIDHALWQWGHEH